MSPSMIYKRRIAVKVADTLNKIEGVPVSEKAQQLSKQWVEGKITGEQMKSILIEMHKLIK